MSAPEASIVATTGSPNVSRRDARLDFFRGLALLAIFIKHVPGTPYEEWTSRNFGFSDAAEAFFVMSGIAAALAVGSALLWFLAGLQRLNFPHYPNPDGWFFNPYAWQAVFVTGLLIGTALTRGERLLPIRRNWIALCAALLLLSLMWRQLPGVGAWCNSVMWQLGKLGLPFHTVGHNKTFLALPRLLHVLALTYLLSALPGVRRLAETRACS